MIIQLIKDLLNDERQSIGIITKNDAYFSIITKTKKGFSQWDKEPKQTVIDFINTEKQGLIDKNDIDYVIRKTLSPKEIREWNTIYKGLQNENNQEEIIKVLKYAFDADIVYDLSEETKFINKKVNRYHFTVNLVEYYFDVDNDDNIQLIHEQFILCNDTSKLIRLFNRYKVLSTRFEKKELDVKFKLENEKCRQLLDRMNLKVLIK
jgi:hypothetical protein